MLSTQLKVYIDPNKQNSSTETSQTRLVSDWNNIHFYNKNICTKTSKEKGSGNKGNVKNINVSSFQYSHKSQLWQTHFFKFYIFET